MPGRKLELGDKGSSSRAVLKTNGQKQEKMSIPALFSAVCGGQVEVLQGLLTLDLNLNARSDSGSTALMEGVKASQRHCCFLLVESKKVDLDLVSCCHIAKLINKINKKKQTDGQGQTALHWAAQMGLDEICSDLIQGKASISVKDSFGRIALCWAVQKCSLAVVKTFVAAGSDVNSRSHVSWLRKRLQKKRTDIIV